MKKLMVFLLLIVTLTTTYAQTANVIIVNTVKPMKGQKMAWEAAWKTHVTKFHTTIEKTNVYEIISGPNAGFYHLVGPAKEFADLDKPRADAQIHSLDLDKTFFPMLDQNMNGFYVAVDSLAFRPNSTAESFVVTVRHLKDGLDIPAYRKESSRFLKIRMAQKSAFWESFSTNYYEQLWDGSDQVTVTIRNLKDGFKSLAANYFPVDPAGSPTFRDLYTKAYGGEAWDARIKLLDGAVAKTDQYIMRWRKDLSSK